MFKYSLIMALLLACTLTACKSKATPTKWDYQIQVKTNQAAIKAVSKVFSQRLQSYSQLQGFEPTYKLQTNADTITVLLRTNVNQLQACRLLSMPGKMQICRAIDDSLYLPFVNALNQLKAPALTNNIAGMLPALNYANEPIILAQPGVYPAFSASRLVFNLPSWPQTAAQIGYPTIKLLYGQMLDHNYRAAYPINELLHLVQPAELMLDDDDHIEILGYTPDKNGTLALAMDEKVIGLINYQGKPKLEFALLKHGFDQTAKAASQYPLPAVVELLNCTDIINNSQGDSK